MTLGADSLRRPSPKSHFESACSNLFKHASKIRGFTAAGFHEKHNYSIYFRRLPCTPIPVFSKSDKNTENTDNIYFNTSSISLCQFPRNTKLIN
jgi:hypothetical protein